MKFHRSFTLIELLVVLAIIAILAMIAIANLLEAHTRSKVTRVKSDTRSIGVALEAYYLDNTEYPRLNPNLECDNGGHLILVWDNFLHYEGGYEPDMGPGGGCPTGLTTPVAYLDGHPPADPFIGKMRLDKTGSVRLTFDRRNCSYFMYNFRNCAAQVYRGWREDLPKVVSPAPMRFNGPNGPVFKAQWALMSPGPDCTFNAPNPDNAKEPFVSYLFVHTKEDWQAMLDGRHCLYDPTNGTNSAGDIWRTNAGAVN